MDKITFVKNIEILKEQANSLIAVKATGIAELKHLLKPVLVTARNYDNPPSDGIYELDFILGSTGDEFTNVEMEVDVVFKLKNFPQWVKGIKVNAKENSDIELIA
jgi:hypothetical protein